eukprot:12663488-Ditylum_brightwellii.AAC.1
MVGPLIDAEVEEASALVLSVKQYNTNGCLQKKGCSEEELQQYLLLKWRRSHLTKMECVGNNNK